MCDITSDEGLENFSHPYVFMSASAPKANDNFVVFQRYRTLYHNP